MITLIVVWVLGILIGASTAMGFVLMLFDNFLTWRESRLVLRDRGSR